MLLVRLPIGNQMWPLAGLIAGALLRTSCYLNFLCGFEARASDESCIQGVAAFKSEIALYSLPEGCSADPYSNACVGFDILWRDELAVAHILVPCIDEYTGEKVAERQLPDQALKVHR